MLNCNFHKIIPGIASGIIVYEKTYKYTQNKLEYSYF